MRDFLKEHPDPVYRSYVWGFVCHYSLDCTAHPYVNWLAVELAKQRPWETPSTMHGEIESALDAIILRFETGKLPSEVPTEGNVPQKRADPAEDCPSCTIMFFSHSMGRMCLKSC